MRGIREVPSVRFRDPSRDCTPRQPGLSSPEYSNISGVSPPEFLASANLLHSLNISEVSPPEFLASANLPDSLNISGVSPLPEFPSQTYLTALDLSIPTKARLVSPPQRATAQVVDPTGSGKWKLQSERPPSARRLQKPWAKIQAKRKIKKPQLNILNQAYGEVPDLPPDKHRPTQYSFTYSPSQRFKPKAVSTPKPEGWESCGSYQHWSPNVVTAHTGEYGWVSTDTDYSPVQSPAHVVPPCPNLPPDKHRPTQYSFTYSPSQRFKPKAVSTPKPEGWESCGSYQHWSPNAGTAHTGEYGWVSTDTDYSPAQSPAHVVPPCPNLPPDKHRPTQYSFTYSPSQRFKPKAVSTPKPEGWESCGSYQHWSPNAGTAHTGEYGWVSLDTDYSPVQSPAHVVPPCPEQCQDSFQRISGRDRTVHVSADSEQQQYDDIDESLLLMWGLTMRRADIPLDPYYEQCIMASPNMIKNPRILANLRREYAEKKRKVQEALERQRFEQALQDLPEVERREITDLENKIIERETEKLRHLLRMLSDKKKLALKNVRVAECLYVEEAQNVKVSIAILENAKKDEDEARIDLKETRQKYSNRQKVKELKRTLKAMKAYKDGLIEERQEILKKKEELLAELKVSEGVESTQAYLNAIKEKSEWWVQELRNRVKNKGESLKVVTQLLEREQKRIEALKQETEETEKLTQEVQIEVDKILLSIKTLSPVIEQLKREIDLKLPAGEPQTPPAGLPMPSPRKKLISQIQFLHKAIEEEKELIHDSLQMLYEEMINYDRIISQGLEHHLRICSNKRKPSFTLYQKNGKLFYYNEPYNPLKGSRNTTSSNGKKQPDCPIGCEELFTTTYSHLSEYNDWNSSLFPTHVLSHSTDSIMFSELLQLANDIQDKDSPRTDVNTQFVKETVKSNKNVSKKRTKKNNKNSNETNKKKKQDKEAPLCSMDIRDCMAIASQKLSQDVSSKDNDDTVIINKPGVVIDLVSENEEGIEIEDEILANFDKELYDNINKLHFLAQNSSDSINVIESHVLKELYCLEMECPRFLTSFDFPNIEDDDITLAKIKNLNIETMFKPCIDSDLVFEDCKINTDELLNKYEVYSNDNSDNFVHTFSNGHESIKHAVYSDKVNSTVLNKTKDVNYVSNVYSEPKPNHEMLKQSCSEYALKDSNNCNKISVRYRRNSSIRLDQNASQLPTINHNKQVKNLKWTENICDIDDNLLCGVQKEILTGNTKIEEKSKRYFEEYDQIIDIENVISPVLSGKVTDSKLKINKECSENKKSLLSLNLICCKRRLENENGNHKSMHFNRKQIYTEKGQVSPILSSGKKTMRKFENHTEHPISPILSNRISICHNGNENDGNKYSISPIMSADVKNCKSLPESGIENYDTENSKSPILSGTRYVKRQTSLKKNLFSDQHEAGLHFVSTSDKTEDKLSTINSSFVSNKSVAERCVKNQYKATNNYSNEMQRSGRSEQLSVSNFLAGVCSSEIVGIDDLFEDMDNIVDKSTKNILSTEKELKETEFNKTKQKSSSCDAESRNEFVFNFDDLFDDDIDGNFSVTAAIAASNEDVQASTVNINGIVKPEKQSCTSPIIISKRINSQSTPRPRRNSFVNNSKLPVDNKSKKLPVIESGSETESNILESPVLKLMQGASNVSCSTPVRNLSSKFSIQKPGRSSKHVVQQQAFVVAKENVTPTTKQIEQVDYFQLDGEDDNWSFSQLFDENKSNGEDDKMYTISQLVAKSSGLPTPEPSKQREESISEGHSEVLSKVKEEKVCLSENDENHLVFCKTATNSALNKELPISENKSIKNSENLVINRHSNIFQFDSDDDLFEGLNSNILSTSGAVCANSTVNQENLNKITSAKKFERDNINEQGNHTKVPESKYNSFTGFIKKKGLSESPGLFRKENIYDEKENILSRKNICFSDSKANKNLSVLNTSKVSVGYDSRKLDSGFRQDIPLKNCDSHVTIKSPLKNCNIVRNYNNSCEKKPVLASGWISTKTVSVLKRPRPDDFTSDDSDAGSVFVSIRKNGISEQIARNGKKKIKKCPLDKNIIVNLANEFVEREAEVSINKTLSSDEENTSGLDDLDESFIDDLTQQPTTAADQSSVNMHAKYLQSVKSPVCGRFKIPSLSDTALQMNVYSQMVEEDDDSYTHDSFCVDETEIADETEPSVLEIAEQILEDRRKKKKKRNRILTYSSTSNSEWEEEDVRLRSSVKKNESKCSDEHSLVINRKRKRRVPTVLSESESDTEIVIHKNLTNNSGSIYNKNILEHSKICGEASNSSSMSSGSKSTELFYRPTLSKLLKSKLKR